HDESRTRRRDQLELPRIDEPGDLLQMLVFAERRVRTESELAGAVVLIGSDRASLAPGQTRARSRSSPRSRVGPDEHSLRRHDAPQHAVDHRYAPSDEHLTLHFSLAERLVVFVT